MHAMYLSQLNWFLPFPFFSLVITFPSQWFFFHRLMRWKLSSHFLWSEVQFTTSCSIPSFYLFECFLLLFILLCACVSVGKTIFVCLFPIINYSLFIVYVYDTFKNVFHNPHDKISCCDIRNLFPFLFLCIHFNFGFFCQWQSHP